MKTQENLNQTSPAEGDRDTIERELQRQDKAQSTPASTTKRGPADHRDDPPVKKP